MIYLGGYLSCSVTSRLVSDFMPSGSINSVSWKPFKPLARTSRGERLLIIVGFPASGSVSKEQNVAAVDLSRSTALNLHYPKWLFGNMCALEILRIGMETKQSKDALPHKLKWLREWLDRCALLTSIADCLSRYPGSVYLKKPGTS